MAVRQPALLELNRQDVARARAKDVLLLQHRDQLLPLHLEDPRDNVWPVLGLLARQQRVCDLLPVGVAREGNEECWVTQRAHNRHCVGILLPEPARAAREAGTQHHAPPKLPRDGNVRLHSSRHTANRVTAQIVLVVPHPLQPVVLLAHVHIGRIL